MEQFWLLLFAALIVGASKGGLVAAGTLAVPLMSIWMDPLTAAGILLPIYIVSDVVGVWLYRHEYSRQNVLLLAAAGLVGVVLATFLAPWLSSTVTTLATGLIGLIYCIQSAVKHWRKVTAAKPFNPYTGFFWGILTGMTSFVSHTGAPPFQAFVMPQKLPKMVFAGTTTIVFAAINLFKLPAYASVGLMSHFEWHTFLALAACASFGAVAGRQLTKWLPDRLYVGLIQTILFLLSIYLVVESTLKLI